MFEDLKVSPEEVVRKIREQARQAILAELAEVAAYHRAQELAAQVSEELEKVEAGIGDARATPQQQRHRARLQQLLDALAEMPAPHLTYLPALWLATGTPAGRGYRVLGAEDLG